MTPLFDVEFLQKLTYERSKTWSFLLDKFVTGEELCAMNVKDVGEAYGSENDESDSSNELASMEECEDGEILDADFLRNITNTARLSVMLNNKTALPDSSFNEKQNELMDIFNQTLPIINEHNRQLQEFGLDKILISFDKEQIEEKVGGWLNRHNSLYGGNKTLLEFGKCKNDEIEENARYAVDKSPVCRKICNDSDDSLQSGETARYIRSSKANGNKKSATTSTIIKTYRMIRSTREATRQKYDCEMVDDKTIRHRRTIDNDYQYRQNNWKLMQFPKNHKYYITPSPPRQRRKVFRKRIFSNSFSTTDSSSDTDYCYEDYQNSKCKNFKFTENRCSVKYSNYLTPKDTTCSIKRSKCHQRSAMKMPSAQANRMYYFSHSQSKSLCYETRKHLKIKRNANCSIEELPFRDELECHCCDEGKLCSNFKHIANSSTEKWYVENCCSPKRNRRISTDNTSEESFTTTETAQKVLRTKNQKAKSKANSKRETAKKATVKSKAENTKSQNKLKHESSNGVENSDYELQLAIEQSKECYEKEQQLKKNNKKKQSKRKILKSKSSRKILKPESEVPNDPVNSIGKLPTQIENGSLVEVEPAKLHLTTSSITEETFFTPTKAICNSTAVSRKSQAYKRQILTKSHIDEEDKSADKLQNKTEIDFKKSYEKSDKTQNSKTKKSKNNRIKSTTAIAKDRKQIEKNAASTKVSSTTKRCLEITTKLASTQSETTEPEQAIYNSSCDSDCTLVTSTTNIVQMPKGILVYAPENRDMLPESSATNNGFFTITKEYLSTVIGEKQAEKFLKSYVGRKRFRLDSTVYYRPTGGEIGKDSSSDSDALDYARQYGDLHEEIK